MNGLRLIGSAVFGAALFATPALALEPEPFMVGVFTLTPEEAEGEDAESTSSLDFGVGRVFSIPLTANAPLSATERVLPLQSDVVGLSLTFTQDISVGFSSYLGVGVGTPVLQLQDSGVADPSAAYEVTLGVKAPVAPGAEVDVGYSFQDSVSGSEASDDEAGDDSHNFMVGVRYSF